MQEKVFTATGSPNIALIKYWGQRNEELVLPFNSSISMTLRGINQPLMTATSVMFSGRLSEDVFYVDGKFEPDPKGAKRVAEAIRARSGTKEHLLMVSYNSFPKASGIASSASASATFAFVASQAQQLQLSPKELSILARLGSGSAARGVYGGFVRWNHGIQVDGSDSYAEQVFDESYWPELNDLIVIVSPMPKKVSSNEGHRLTRDTSPLFSSRPAFAENGAGVIERALRDRDFEALGIATMRDSDNMHATAETSWPPIIYRNADSRRIMEYVTELNEIYGSVVAAYTFDAGPNAHIITTDEFKGKILEGLNELGFMNVIEAKAGPGPRLLDAEFDLIDNSTLLPKEQDMSSYFSSIKRQL